MRTYPIRKQATKSSWGENTYTTINKGLGATTCQIGIRPWSAVMLFWCNMRGALNFAVMSRTPLANGVTQHAFVVIIALAATNTGESQC